MELLRLGTPSGPQCGTPVSSPFLILIGGVPEIDNDGLPLVNFSSKKLLDQVQGFRYTIEDMFDAAIKACRETGLSLFATAGGDGSVREPEETGAALVKDGPAIGA
jgi:bifunctional dihydroflavonol 4-reductase/flavanone 4-reductase